MARRPREHLQCNDCGWVGMTKLGVLRYSLFVATTAAAVILVGLEFLGVIALGDQVWPIAISIMILSIGVRLLIRGDRCRECGGLASYSKG